MNKELKIENEIIKSELTKSKQEIQLLKAMVETLSIELEQMRNIKEHKSNMAYPC